MAIFTCSKCGMFADSDDGGIEDPENKLELICVSCLESMNDDDNDTRMRARMIRNGFWDEVHHKWTDKALKKWK